MDITKTARNIIGCINDCYRSYGVTTILDTLRGAHTDKIERYRLDENAYYGAESDKTITFLRKTVDHMLLHGYLDKSDDRYGLLYTGEKAGQLLLKGGVLKMKVAREKERECASAKKKAASAALHTENPQLFEELRALRMKLAKTQSVPPYVIFTDKTLKELCSLMPSTKDEMLKVSGVGETKLQKYGEDFLEIIRKHRLV